VFLVHNGHIKRITDSDIQTSVIEIMGTNVATCFIQCPADEKNTLGIKLPFLVMIIKNMKKYFSFEVQVLDDKNIKRRFRASNYQVNSFKIYLFILVFVIFFLFICIHVQSATRVKPFICTMPMHLDEGWNQIQFNLSDFTRRAYGKKYFGFFFFFFFFFFGDYFLLICFLIYNYMIYNYRNIESPNPLQLSYPPYLLLR
jgi:hypothetical protein